MGRTFDMDTTDGVREMEDDEGWCEQVIQLSGAQGEEGCGKQELRWMKSFGPWSRYGGLDWDLEMKRQLPEMLILMLL